MDFGKGRKKDQRRCAKTELVGGILLVCGLLEARGTCAHCPWAVDVDYVDERVSVGESVPRETELLIPLLAFLEPIISARGAS